MRQAETGRQPEASGHVPTSRSWNIEEIEALKGIDASNVFLRYAAYQLELQQKSSLEQQELEKASGDRRRSPVNRGHRSDLLSLFAGRSAIEECLQLDELRADRNLLDEDEPSTVNPLKRWVKGDQMVEVSSISGPKAKSHPWAEMLHGKPAVVSSLSKFIPDDLLFVESTSIHRMFEVFHSLHAWGVSAATQVFKRQENRMLIEDFCEQMLLSAADMELFEKGQVAIASSDLFAFEGSDWTLLVKAADADLFRATVLANLADLPFFESMSERQLQYRGITITNMFCVERRLDVFFAEIDGGVFARSTSVSVLERIIRSAQGSYASLGRSDEFKYVRHLMPSDSEEDVFIYFSDAFIRNLVGPQLRLTERRRLSCLSNLNLLDAATMFHATQYGEWCDDLSSLLDKASGRELLQEALICPESGAYSLAFFNGITHGACSVHGTSSFLTPCSSLQLTHVTTREAEEYAQFVQQYDAYWTQYFDPIAVRVKSTANALIGEVLVLPVIENSVYSHLAAIVGETSNSLEPEFVPKKTIFSTALAFNKQFLQVMLGGFQFGIPVAADVLRDIDLASSLLEILGNQISLHVFDSEPALSVDTSTLLGAMISVGAGSSAPVPPLMLFAVSGLVAPTCACVKISDQAKLDNLLQDYANQRGNQPVAGLPASISRFDLGQSDCSDAYCCVVDVGPVKLRFYWARIGAQLIVASKEYILHELVAAMKGSSPLDDILYVDQAAGGHAMARIRCANWDRVLSDLAVGQAETNARVCQRNLLDLTIYRKALCSVAESQAHLLPPSVPSAFEDPLQSLIDKLTCPEHGVYGMDKSTSCTVHGEAGQLRQPRSSSVRFMRDASAITAQLSYFGDGIRGRLTIDRAPKS
jgi:hypothetical protein